MSLNLVKQNIILWISTGVIVFLSFYIQKITSGDYPLTGVIAIGNSELIYRLEKTALADEQIKILVQTDNKNLSGILEWKTSDEDLQIINMPYSKGTYSAMIPEQKVGKNIFYRINFKQGDKTKTIPSNNFIEMKVLGKIPSMLDFYYSLFLILGMMLAVRTGLEYFNAHQKIKKLALITIFFFFGFLIFTPLKLSYEIGAINHFVPNITDLFNLQSILFLMLWIISTVAIFRTGNLKIISLLAGIISIVLLFLF